MRQAIPIVSALAPRRLPTPVVNTLHAQEPVDLRPMGNTVAVTTTAQNPFTQPAVVTVRTQASGGMAPVPESMASRGLVGRFLPGLGQDPNTTNQGTPATEKTSGWTGLLTAGQSVADVLTAQAQAQTAQAQAAAEQARADAARAGGGPMLVETLPKGLMLGGLALLGVVGFMMMKSKKSGRGYTGRRRSRSRR